jgi:glycosyltransferase involved in cell wall biosynthesis
VKVALFTWGLGGHHLTYIRRFAEALRSLDVVACGHAELLADLGEAGIETYALPPLSRAYPRFRISLGHAQLADHELRLLEEAARKLRPDHIVHLYAHVYLMWRWLSRPSLGARASLLLLSPSSIHYPEAYSTPLSLPERVRARVKDRIEERWQRRPEAHALLTPDEEAARRWSRRPGAQGHWIPEPPVSDFRPQSNAREGCIVYGALSRRKGIHYLAHAVDLAPTSLKVTLAGEVEREFEDELQRCVDRMRRAGATVELRARRHAEREGLEALASARCAVVPYPRFRGPSRVVLEAAVAGTPLVVHDYGLVGHQVRHYRLGHVVDCTDARALRDAVLSLTEDPDAGSRYGDALRRFAERHSAEKFNSAVAAIFAGDTVGGPG